jgi:hypothetical protein
MRPKFRLIPHTRLPRSPHCMLLSPRTHEDAAHFPKLRSYASLLPATHRAINAVPY